MERKFKIMRSLPEKIRVRNCPGEEKMIILNDSGCRLVQIENLRKMINAFHFKSGVGGGGTCPVQ